MATNEGLSVEIATSLRDAISNFSQLSGSIDGVGESISSISGDSNAASAGLGNLSRAVNEASNAFIGLTTAEGDAAETLSTTVSGISNATNRLSPAPIIDFNRALTDGQLSIQAFTGAAQEEERVLHDIPTSAGRAAGALSGFANSGLSIKELTQLLNQLKKSLESAVDPQAIASYNRSIQSLNQRIQEIRTGGVTPLGSSLNNTATSLSNFNRTGVNTGQVFTNVGRIISDAPYGFIAIQNNIDPLIASLGGPAGLALAFTIVGSAATVLAQKYGGLGNALKALFGNYSLADQVTDGFNKELEKSTKAAGDNYAKVALLKQAIDDVTLSQNDRKAAAEEYNKIADKGNQIDLTQLDNLSKVNDQIEKQIQLIGKRAIAQAAENELGKAAAKLLQTQQKLKPIIDAHDSQRLEKYADGVDALNQAVKESEKAGTGTKLTLPSPNQFLNSDFAKKQQQNFLQQRAIFAKALSNPNGPEAIAAQQATMASQKYQDALKEMQQAQSEFDQTLNQLAPLTDVEGLTSKDKVEKSGKTISSVLAELQKELANVDAQAQLTGASFDSVAKDKITALRKAFEELIKLGLTPASPEIKKIADQITNLQDKTIGDKPLSSVYLNDFDKVNKKIKTLNSSEIILPGVDLTNVDTSLVGVDKATTAYQKKIKDMRQAIQTQIDKTQIRWGNISAGLGPAVVNLSAQINTALAGFTSSLGEAIGGLASGGATLAQSLGKLVGVMGQFIIDFGKSLIEAATLRIIAEKTLIANPYIALAAGVAAIALGSVLKNKVPSFATGGIVTSPTLAMVGDNPGRKEAIIPSEMWDKIGVSGNAFIAETRISGGDLLILMKKSDREGRR